MYTQCPDCSAAFRVTANDLKQAGGKVRCGGCGSAFDALEFLSEDMPTRPPAKEPGPRLPELSPDRPADSSPEAVSPEESIALLKTLDQLAGSDIRLEDTGIEWRVLDEQVIAELELPGGRDRAEETDNPSPSGDQRFDDESPVPEGSVDEDTIVVPEEAVSDEQAPDEEVTRSSDDIDVEFDDRETGDWEEILDEVGEPGSGDQADEEELPELLDEADEAGESDDAGEAVLGEDDREIAGDETAGDVEERRDEGDEENRRDDAADEEDNDQDGAADDDDGRLPDVDELEVEIESIVLEGETVRNALEEPADSAQATDADTAYWLPRDETVAPARSAAARIGMASAALLLLLLLGLQIVHYYRQTLATIPAVQRILAPAYRAIGMPLSPYWDVTAWRFEATQGRIDADKDELTVYSRIGNTGDQPLPYPLIRISLTDRFDETVGSRLLDPEEFLVDGADTRRPVAPGATFDAVISIRSPDESATGYRLSVCYRSAYGATAGKLRCATGDFKE